MWHGESVVTGKPDLLQHGRGSPAGWLSPLNVTRLLRPAHLHQSEALAVTDQPDSTERLFTEALKPNPVDPRPARDLSAGELQSLIQDGVYRGVMKAVGTYLLISALVALFVYLLSKD